MIKIFFPSKDSIQFFFVTSRDPKITYDRYRHVHVKCPEMQCGMRTKSLSKHRYIRDIGESEAGDEFVGITNGQSSVNNWPFIVSVHHKEGHICGGTIFNQEWVIIKNFIIVCYSIQM